ncbi:hypothetical protein RO3G_15042 [Rhizopus delemar RA 99-880]|uniref:Uncharacterized protein n=1 Tax=Rhizopus delemar (strain RA 99-880 / ATCC MYA-4621 / FGSC 9543 / NRRL 43880) TaxID=246409 RepID=I1CPF1_RHIO9|nr:hypothetical protein RO3G_15042 [Rhizopus delemar RA 99-880]|eukprot:EIE90331.1 hypothetical protein RO3G_15042 [Rhizopus delemar RA 99-880]
MDQAQVMFFLSNAWLKVKSETTKGMLPGLPRSFDNKVTDVSQLNLKADEKQDEQRVDIVECKKRSKEAYKTILVCEVPLDDLDLASLIYKSPHRRLLASREYFELDDTVELLLNKDWLHEPQVKFARAQVLAGTVLMNVSNGEAILVNTVEMYGGTKPADIHRELPFSSNMSIFTTKPTYANIWPHIRSTGDGSKRVIVTQTCTALITSIVCLDQSEEPKMGPSSCHFATSPQHTKIFIDQSLSTAIMKAQQSRWTMKTLS